MYLYKGFSGPIACDTLGLKETLLDVVEALRGKALIENAKKANRKAAEMVIIFALSLRLFIFLFSPISFISFRFQDLLILGRNACLRSNIQTAA